MVRAVLICACMLLVPLLASAQEIHKCVSADGITYQGHPCDGRDATASAPVGNTSSTIRVSNVQATPECGPRPRTPPRLPWRQATICIGMTDDEVLNLPGWGRPDKIVRTREQRLWHESWTYDDVRFAARRLLRFVNGNLAAVDTEPIVEVSNGSLASLEVSN
jgi:hypothetical protein